MTSPRRDRRYIETMSVVGGRAIVDNALVDRDVASARPLRILLDARKLGDGGIGVYIDNLVHGLLNSGAVSLTLIGHPDRAASTQYVRDVEWIYDSAPHYSIDELLFMPRRLATSHGAALSTFDLFHAPHYMLPFGLPIPSIVTVHDLIHITHPERFFYPLVARSLIRSAVKRATAVIAVSQDTRKQILKLAPTSLSKVVHIPNAVAERLITQAPKSGCTKRIAELSPFLLGVFSTVKPHKALPDLVQAYQAFRRAYVENSNQGRVPRLVLVGYGTEQLLNSEDLLGVIGNTEGVHILGSVAPEELASLYRKAVALIVPSLTEGFCLPAIEAQACGTPVVCRPVPALLELVTERDVVAADFSVQSLAAALFEGTRRGLMQPRLAPVMPLHLFSRERVASLTVDVYRSALHATESA